MAPSSRPIRATSAWRNVKKWKRSPRAGRRGCNDDAGSAEAGEPRPLWRTAAAELSPASFGRRAGGIGGRDAGAGRRLRGLRAHLETVALGHGGTGAISAGPVPGVAGWAFDRSLGPQVCVARSTDNRHDGVGGAGGGFVLPRSIVAGVRIAGARRRRPGAGDAGPLVAVAAGGAGVAVEQRRQLE